MVVDSATKRVPFNTWETVAVETDASLATSLILTRFIQIKSFSMRSPKRLRVLL